MEETQKESSIRNTNSFGDPVELIDLLEIDKGNVAADFGCGPGYYTFALADKVGEDGKVYALDVLPEALESIESKIKSNGYGNIFTKRVNLEKEGGSNLGDETMDWVVMKNVLFQNKDKKTILGEARRVLRSGGKALIVEWNEKDSPMGPGKELRISPEEMKRIVSEENFSIEKEFNVGDFHYAIVVGK